MTANSAIKLVVVPVLFAAFLCHGDENMSTGQPIAVATESSAAAASSMTKLQEGFSTGIGGEQEAGLPETTSLVVGEIAPLGLDAPEPIAQSDVDEAAFSNAVAVAVATAVAVEEAKAAAAAQERAEAREDAERAEAKVEASLARRRISSKVFKLEHASAEEVADKLNATWSGDFGAAWKITKMAVAFPESNSIIVTAPVAILDACGEIIRGIDAEPMQVYIEARFVELSNNVFHDVGIDWSMLGGMKGTVSVGGGIQGNRLGKGVTGYTRTLADGTTYSLAGSSVADGITYGGHDGDITYFNGTLDFSQMYVVLSALEGSQDARIFSNPKIIVSSGKKATVDMTTKYPNVKIAAKRTTNAGGDSLDLDMQMAAIPGEDKMMFAKESFFSWGISLDVTPRIGTNGLINVSIVPTISSQNGWVESGTASDADSGTISARYPVIEVQRLVTEFSMASGTTAVIGGLSRTVEEQVDNGIPLLRDIPWVGPKLFGSMARKKQQKEIVVFVTVGLVNPKDMRKDAGLPKNAVLGRQYTKGQKLEPGDRPEKNLEGIGSLDLRSLEEQALDPLPPPSTGTSSWIPFANDKKNKTKNN